MKETRRFKERGDNIMRSNFTRGLIIGSLIGASVGMAMNSDTMMSNRTRRKMRRKGMDFVKKSGDLISDMVELFR
ncbi:MAG TPA: YtxH domain-containing protein [Acetivibrio sp.]|uniref:YtxH domain-containing protein n=1 Tax=Acetivibrio sp. TaxID=1872092 RepID=UPI002CCB3371|nr:YtxH domain-containing protein [Acetivibrio sp.]HOM02546.1 YtxH domain-containing protein [Acetivibrio sp.]